MKPIEEIKTEIKTIQDDIKVLKDLLKYIKQYVDEKKERDNNRWF
tara:strand:+ start:662 stop:796 length:135 start_codon:yes stop_codon:yes gene_type:complete